MALGQARRAAAFRTGAVITSCQGAPFVGRGVGRAFRRGGPSSLLGLVGLRARRRRLALRRSPAARGGRAQALAERGSYGGGGRWRRRVIALVARPAFALSCRGATGAPRTLGGFQSTTPRQPGGGATSTGATGSAGGRFVIQAPRARTGRPAPTPISASGVSIGRPRRRACTRRALARPQAPGRGATGATATAIGAAFAGAAGPSTTRRCPGPFSQPGAGQARGGACRGEARAGVGSGAAFACVTGHGRAGKVGAGRPSAVGAMASFRPGQGAREPA